MNVINAGVTSPNVSAWPIFVHLKSEGTPILSFAAESNFANSVKFGLNRAQKSFCFVFHAFTTTFCTIRLFLNLDSESGGGASASRLEGAEAD